MAKRKKAEKEDRWWLADLLLTAGELLLYLPRFVFRIIKDIN